MRPDDNDPRRVIRKLNLIGFGTLIVLFGGVGGWAATTELAGAVIAPGTVVVESNVKKVQHPTGGIVGEILVKEGSWVEAGQVVIRLDATLTRATLGIVQSQLDELVAKHARLLVERDGSEAITFPDELTRRRGILTVDAAIAGEQRLFESRRDARIGQKAQLRERIAQINEEIGGLAAQQAAKEKEIRFVGEELSGVADLYKRNLVTIVRYMQLQRDQAKLEGERGQFTAEIARARGRIVEMELQILQLDQDFRTEVLRDLRDAQAKIAELKERLTAAEDQLARVEIRAPQSGIVHQLAIHTVGGVIGHGETLMLVVPNEDVLLVEAKVAAPEIDQVTLGTRAAVRIVAGNQRTSPNLEGVITHVSADLTRDQQTNQTYYIVRLSLPPEELRNLGDLNLVPGMSAEVFVQTGERTPLEYLLKPLREQIARTFRER
jgi:HlyD family secretion protein